MPPTKSSVFSVLPQEHFLLDILWVPLVGMQSIRRALVGLPLHFPQYCIEGHWQRLLSRNWWCAKNAFQRRSFWYFFLCHYYPEGLKHPVNTLGDTHRLQRNFLFFLTFFLAKNRKKPSKYRRAFMRSPMRPQNKKMEPDSLGSSLKPALTTAIRPSIPLLRSVYPVQR